MQTVSQGNSSHKGGSVSDMLDLQFRDPTYSIKTSSDSGALHIDAVEAPAYNYTRFCDLADRSPGQLYVPSRDSITSDNFLKFCQMSHVKDWSKTRPDPAKYTRNARCPLSELFLLSQNICAAIQCGVPGATTAVLVDILDLISMGSHFSSIFVGATTVRALQKYFNKDGLARIAFIAYIKAGPRKAETTLRLYAQALLTKYKLEPFRLFGEVVDLDPEMAWNVDGVFAFKAIGAYDAMVSNPLPGLYRAQLDELKSQVTKAIDRVADGAPERLYTEAVERYRQMAAKAMHHGVMGEELPSLRPGPINFTYAGTEQSAEFVRVDKFYETTITKSSAVPMGVNYITNLDGYAVNADQPCTLVVRAIKNGRPATDFGTVDIPAETYVNLDMARASCKFPKTTVSYLVYAILPNTSVEDSVNVRLQFTDIGTPDVGTPPPPPPIAGDVGAGSLTAARGGAGGSAPPPAPASSWWLPKKLMNPRGEAVILPSVVQVGDVYSFTVTVPAIDGDQVKAYMPIVSVRPGRYTLELIEPPALLLRISIQKAEVTASGDLKMATFRSPMSINPGRTSMYMEPGMKSNKDWKERKTVAAADQALSLKSYTNSDMLFLNAVFERTTSLHRVTLRLRYTSL